LWLKMKGKTQGLPVIAPLVVTHGVVGTITIGAMVVVVVDVVVVLVVVVVVVVVVLVDVVVDVVLVVVVVVVVVVGIALQVLTVCVPTREHSRPEQQVPTRLAQNWLMARQAVYWQ